MKRFIDLGTQAGQSEDYPKQFAFINTTTNHFEEFSGSQIWDSKEEFIQDFEGDDLERYLRLIPEGWPENRNAGI